MDIDGLEAVRCMWTSDIESDGFERICVCVCPDVCVSVILNRETKSGYLGTHS